MDSQFFNGLTFGYIIDSSLPAITWLLSSEQGELPFSLFFVVASKRYVATTFLKLESPDFLASDSPNLGG
jgi:hypothetical protein